MSLSESIKLLRTNVSFLKTFFSMTAKKERKYRWHI